MAVFRVGRLSGGSSLGGGDALSAVVSAVFAVAAAGPGAVAATNATTIIGSAPQPELYFIGPAGPVVVTGGAPIRSLVGGDRNA